MSKRKHNSHASQLSSQIQGHREKGADLVACWGSSPSSSCPLLPFLFLFRPEKHCISPHAPTQLGRTRGGPGKGVRTNMGGRARSWLGSSSSQSVSVCLLARSIHTVIHSSIHPPFPCVGSQPPAPSLVALSQVGEWVPQ